MSPLLLGTRAGRRCRRPVGRIANGPARTILEHWHHDIGLAASAYVDAWGEVAKRMMDGTGDPLQPLIGPNGSVTNGVGNDALAPVSSWLDCWAPVFR